MNRPVLTKLGIAGRWTGRLAALLLLLFWGAFFIEHLSEWFLRRGGAYPPVWVWVLQFFHFVILLGMGLMLKWEKVGAPLVVVGALAFFGGIMLQSSRFETSLFLFALLTMVPIAGFAVYRFSLWKERCRVSR
jgi:hypothetical protein